MNTISFSESVNGWTSFFDFVPDWMLALNNEFYSIKEGQLWKHNSEEVPRNNFYGTQYISSITVVFNEEAGLDKAFKSVQQESTSAWKLTASTNYTEGVIEPGEFLKRESRYYAHLRRNEETVDLSYINACGLGFAIGVNETSIQFQNINPKLSLGDQLKAKIGEDIIDLGTVVTIEGNSVFMDQANNLGDVEGNYVFGLKNSRAEGGNLRGYYLEVKLENDSTKNEELFAVNVEAAKSFT